MKEPHEVTVTFVEPERAKNANAITAALALIGLLATLTPDQMVAFDAGLQRRTPFFGAREVVW